MNTLPWDVIAPLLLGLFAILIAFAIVAVTLWYKARVRELAAHQDLRVREMEHQRNLKQLELEIERVRAGQTGEPGKARVA